MRLRTSLLVVLLVFASAPMQAQRPAAPFRIIQQIFSFVPRLLGDHLSPPHPTPGETSARKCSTCK